MLYFNWIKDCSKKGKNDCPTGIKPVLKITVKSKWNKITSFKVTENHLVRM